MNFEKQILQINDIRKDFQTMSCFEFGASLVAKVYNIRFGTLGKFRGHKSLYNIHYSAEIKSGMRKWYSSNKHRSTTQKIS